MRLKHKKLAFLGTAAVGLALLVMMILVEDEPGAIPLALLLIGAVGYAYCKARERTTRGKL